ncbi:hypothetical protein BDV93DRAFT_518805, partial [Ceratobasidium sp. AG-I]
MHATSNLVPAYTAIIAGGSSSRSRDPRLPNSLFTNERTTLLGPQLPHISEHGGYDAEDGGRRAQDNVIIVQSSRAVRVGGRRNSLPLYVHNENTQRPIPFRGAVGVLLYLVLIAMLVGGALLIQSGGQKTNTAQTL